MRQETGAGNHGHRAELDEIIKDWARGQTRQAIRDALRGLGYFGAPVLSLGEVMRDPHAKARQAFVERNHPERRANEDSRAVDALFDYSGEHSR